MDKKSSTVNKQDPDKNGSSLNNGPKHTDLALKPKTERPPAIKFFPGEDPFYGERSLYVDLPPFTAKYSSLRNLVTPESWKKIVNLVLSRAEKNVNCADFLSPSAHLKNSKSIPGGIFPCRKIH